MIIIGLYCFVHFIMHLLLKISGFHGKFMQVKVKAELRITICFLLLGVEVGGGGGGVSVIMQIISNCFIQSV